MKKISKKARWRLTQLFKVLRRKRRKELIQKRKHINSKKIVYVDNFLVKNITAPKIFDIDGKKERRYIIDFLRKLRRIFIQNNVQKIIIDFSNTGSFVAGATLLFHAELSRLVEMRGDEVTVSYKPPRNDKAFEVLRQIGFYKICGKNPRKRSGQNYDDVVHWRVAKGSVVDNSLCASAIEKYEGQLAEPLINGLFRGLGEAMTNTIHHAYIDVREDGLDYSPPAKNWWMFSQARDNYLSVVFCDLGIGISRTLPLKKPNLFKKIISMQLQRKDSEYIKIAIEDRLTRTREYGRGRGLGDIVDIVAKQKAGIVKIFSNRGVFIQNETNTVTHDLKESILGTLITWRVPLTNDFHRGKDNN